MIVAARAIEARTLLVTGAGRGIGRAIALDLAKSTGATLLLVSRSESAVAVARECEAIRIGIGAEAASVKAFAWDVTTTGAARDAVLAAVDGSAGPIGLVHAAGVLGPTGAFVDQSIDAWWNALEQNLGGAVRLVHAMLPRMLRDGAGRVVLFAGGGAAYGYPRFSSYATAKVALVRFVETLALEIGDAGPILTIIAPGANETEMLAEVRRAGGEVKTTVSIEEPCRLVRRLVTEDCRGLHGRFIHVRDKWDSESAASLPESHWKLRRVE